MLEQFVFRTLILNYKEPSIYTCCRNISRDLFEDRVTIHLGRLRLGLPSLPSLAGCRNIAMKLKYIRLKRLPLFTLGEYVLMKHKIYTGFRRTMKCYFCFVISDVACRFLVLRRHFKLILRTESTYCFRRYFKCWYPYLNWNEQFLFIGNQ